MITIIKPGSKKEVECPKCGAVLSYDSAEDIKRRDEFSDPSWYGEQYKFTRHFITCPQCEFDIFLGMSGK